MANSKKISHEDADQAADKAKHIEDDLKSKRKKRKKKSGFSPADNDRPELSQRMVAPLIMIFLAVVSYLVFLLAR